MSNDDHYIANAANAHVDTSAFENRARELLSAPDLETTEILESIYLAAFSRTNIAPEQPSDDQLICRYLTLDKFLRFIHTRSVNFPIATQFSDPWECRITQDYETAVFRLLGEHNISADAWMKVVGLKAADWNVSCWTQLDNFFDDHLMWHAYAGGPFGVGITVRYGVLRSILSEAADSLDRDGQLYAGRVNYETVSLLPFSKHSIFRNEREIRFAFRAFQPGATSVSIDDIFQSFGIRISPAATLEHHDMMRGLWLKYGGTDRVQWPQ